jgi:hypothetical protein
MSSALRAQFISVALIVFIGIWLTGFNKVHWFLYVPLILFSLAGITGICMDLYFGKRSGSNNTFFCFFL